MMNKIKNHTFLLLLAAGLFTAHSCHNDSREHMDRLRAGFTDPPVEARPRAYLDFVDGNFQLEEITREMEEAKAKGMGGFDIWDVRSVVDEDNIMPAGPAFMGDESVEAICHAIREAERLDMDLGLVIASGWNAGGSWTLPEHQTMGLFRSRAEFTGPGKIIQKLEFPELPAAVGKPGREKGAWIPMGEDHLPLFWKDVAVLATRVEGDNLLEEVFDISAFMDEKGVLHWDAPEGEWQVTRYVCTNTGETLISCTPHSVGPMIDHFNPEAAERHITYFIERIEEKLGRPIGGSGLKYFYTDSYEVRGELWTPLMAEEFEARFGYSLIPYLPVLDGQTVGDAESSRRFMYDYRKLLSDLMVENHYGKIREVCETHGVAFVAEAAGPGPPIHNCPFESLHSSGILSFPRGEFWHIPDHAWWKENLGQDRLKHYLWDLQVIKGVASASHIYDRKYVEAEAFTGTHLWSEGPGDLKATADRAFCEGLNRIIYHTWPHTPEEAGTPGWVYAFGTLVNEHRIWWPMARPWNDYLARCSYLLQQGNFVGDALFFYGDSAPNFVPPKIVHPSLGFGFDYDVCNTDILLNKLDVKDGKLVLPHGQTYEILALPPIEYMQPEILSGIMELVQAGATVVGPRPVRSHGLLEAGARDREVQELAGQLWGPCDGLKVTRNDYGKGQVIWGESLRAVLNERGVGPDFTFEGTVSNENFDFIHRREGETDIYFIWNMARFPVAGKGIFRQKGKKAEYWDPATGRMYRAMNVKEGKEGTELALWMDALGSLFVVFSPDPGDRGQVEDRSIFGGFLEGKIGETIEMEGPWLVDFPEESAGAGRVVFDELQSWNERPEDGVRFFSGIAAYEKEFQWEGDTKGVFIQFGDVVEVARLWVNDQDMGILWKQPFRAEISAALKEGTNTLRVEVANTWHNGLAWDARLPDEQRRTRTNVRRLPNAWTFPMAEIPNEQYDLIPGGITGEVKLLKIKP